MELQDTAAQPITAVVLAGGAGTRIRHLLDGKPKPLAVVANRPFLEWLVTFLRKSGIEEIIISSGYKAELINQFCIKLRPSIKIRAVAESIPMGTAGGFLNAAHGETRQIWLVCNGDTLIAADLRSFITEFHASDADAAILGLHSHGEFRFGSLQCDDKSNLVSFTEKQESSALINAGIYLIRGSLLKDFPQTRPLSFEYQVFPALLYSGRKIYVHQVNAPFIDIGTENTLKEADAFINKNLSHFYDLSRV